MRNTCGQARRLLWPSGPRVATTETAWVKEHLDGCLACRQFLEDMQRFPEELHRVAGGEIAPPEVRTRLFAAVAKARVARGVGRQRRWRMLAYAVLTTAAVVAFVLFAPGTKASADSHAAALVQDHVRARLDDTIASADPAEVERWLRRRVTFAARVPPLENGSLRGGRICFMDGRAGAVVEYQIQGVPVSYYVIPDDETAPRTSQPQLEFATSAGYRVVTWRDAGLLHALVAALPESRLAELAHLCLEQMLARRPSPGPEDAFPSRPSLRTS